LFFLGFTVTVALST